MVAESVVRLVSVAEPRLGTEAKGETTAAVVEMSHSIHPCTIRMAYRNLFHRTRAADRFAAS